MVDAVSEVKEEVAKAVSEINASLTNAFGDLAATIKSLNEQVAAVTKSLDTVTADVNGIKSNFNEFGKRVDLVEQDTAFRKSGDLGEIVQESPQVVQYRRIPQCICGITLFTLVRQKKDWLTLFIKFS